MSRLEGVQYVRLAPGAAEAVAPYLQALAAEIDELVLDVGVWPDEIRPAPLPARDGRLVAGDPLLIDASDAGLLFARGSVPGEAVLVRWAQVRDMQVLGATHHSRAEGP